MEPVSVSLEIMLFDWWSLRNRIPNQPGAVNGGIALRFHCGGLWPAVTDPDRYDASRWGREFQVPSVFGRLEMEFDLVLVHPPQLIQ